MTRPSPSSPVQEPSLRGIGRRLLLALLVAFWVPGTRAQLPGAPETPVPTAASATTAAPEDPAQRAAELRKQVESLLGEARERFQSLPPPPEQHSEAPTPATTGTTAPVDPVAQALAKVEASTRTVLEEEIEDLEATLLLVDQELALADRLHGVQEERSRLQGALETLRKSGPEEKPPYSFLLVDQLRDELENLELGATVEAAALDLALAAVDSAREQQEQAEALRRQHKEAVDALEGGGPEQRLVRERLAGAEARVLLEGQRLRVRLEEREIEKGRKEIRALRITHLAEKMDWIQARTQFTRKDLELKQSQLAEDRKELEAQVPRTQARLSELQKSWSQLQKKLQASKEPSISLVEQEKARRLEIRLLRLQVSYLGSWIGWIETREESWQRRFQLATRSDLERPELSEWETRTRTQLGDLDRAHRLATLRLSELRKEFLQLETSLEEGATGKVNWWTKHSLELRQRLIQVGDEHLERIEEVRRDQEKLLADLEARAPSLLRRDWVGEARALLGAIWDFELFVAEDRPITVGKVLVALVLLLGGFWLARRGSQSVRGFFEERLGVDSGAAASVESIVFYLLLLAFTLFALNLAGVPLTVFAFVGGAVAIGLGFGSQTLINNFISGVLLLLERPIQVGDLVKVGDNTGRITRIGARCTNLRTLAGADILIPNSSFLEGNVVNLTLGDRKLRVDLAVGVTYGTSPEKVKQALLEVATDHAEVLQDPAPGVLFMDFGASSLDFELRVWVQINRGTSLDRLRSDLRYAIEKRFAADGLEMPFPQRDVHLDTPEALRVVVEKAKEEE